MPGYLVEALRTIGRPAPLGEILRVANAGLPDAARLSPQQARADLLKKRNRVRHYGNDVFGLRDGSRRRGNSIADVAQRVIAEAGRPLAVTQIVDRVVRELGVRPRSVRICIMTDHRFTRVSRGVYRLADGLPQRTGMLL